MVIVVDKDEFCYEPNRQFCIQQTSSNGYRIKRSTRFSSVFLKSIKLKVYCIVIIIEAQGASEI